MRRHHYFQSIISALMFVAVLLAPASGGLADDSLLFSTRATPNVLFLLDTSMSMHRISWHPAFDPENIPTDCDDMGEDVPAEIVVDGGPNLANYRLWTLCGNTRLIYYDFYYWLTHGGTSTWARNYLKWYFSDAADPYADLSPAGTIFTTTNTVNDCLGGGGTFFSHLRTNITALRHVLQDVICDVSSKAKVRIGLAQLRGATTPGGSDPRGGYVTVPIDDFTEDHKLDLLNYINTADLGWGTPLAEALYQTYSYFMSRDTDDLPTGRDDTTQFKEYVFKTNGEKGVGNEVPPSPIEEYCQKNFVVVLTDGQPHSDDFDYDPGNIDDALDWDANAVNGPDSDWGFELWKTLIYDYNPDGPDICGGGVCIAQELISEGFAEAFGGGYNLWLDDIAAFMHQNDMRPDLPDVEDVDPDDLNAIQRVDVYTIGFTTNDAADALLQQTADAGGGRFFNSDDPSELAASMSEIFYDVLGKAQSFSTPTVPASTVGNGEGSLYYTSFEPTDFGFWKGHIDMLKLSGDGRFEDESGCALQSNGVANECRSGALKPRGEDADPDNLPVPELDPFWDAGEHIPGPNSRKLYVSLASAMTTRSEPPVFEFDDTAGPNKLAADELGLVDDDVEPVCPDEEPACDLGALPDLRGPDDEIAPYADYYPDSSATTLDELAEEIVDYFAGCEFGTLRSDGSCDTRDWLLGDIYHGTPVMIGSPSAAINDQSYGRTVGGEEGFAVRNRTRDRMLYAASNDGFLHGFMAGRYFDDPSDSDPGVWVTERKQLPAVFSPKPGDELFAFMPWQVRQNIRHQPLDVRARDYFFVDGPPQAADVWFDGYVANPVAPGAPQIDQDKQPHEWLTVLMGGLRQGGSQYYALDVTYEKSHEDEYPLYLWEFPCEAGSALCDTDHEDARSYMGETWSQPVIARIQVKEDAHGNDCPGFPNQGCERWVAIVGGGYAEESDPNNGAYSDPADQSVKTGRAIYVLDAVTGEVLAAKRYDGPTSIEDDMKYAFPSAPSVFDLDQDGYADVIYIGDLGGQVWRWVITDVCDNTGNLNSRCADEWEFEKVFEADICEADLGDACESNGAARYKSFFYPPAGLLVQGQLWLGMGTGERADVLWQGLATTEEDNNYYFVFTDYDPLQKQGTPDVLEMSDLIDPQTLEECKLPGGFRGYKIMGRDEDTIDADDGVTSSFDVRHEKFIADSTIFFRVLLTSSFMPQIEDVDPCDGNHAGFLYIFDLTCGVGYNYGESDEEDKRRYYSGHGLPSTPQVTAGDLNDSDCGILLIGLSSDGGMNSSCAKWQGVPIETQEWRERDLSY